MEDDDSDNSAFCEKIISEINVVFNKDADLASFEIIPVSSDQNKSPVIHQEHNLGLESWCVKYVYEYAHSAVVHSRQCKKQFYNASDLVKYLNVALLINPDVATFWNMRRTMVEKNQLNTIKEFQFSAIVLSIKPKSNEAFAYRRWLYLFQSEESIDWTIELSLCERCSDKNTSNYHAWSHRQWVLDKAPHLLKFEMYKTEKYIRKHVSDYSCYHHRQYVLRTLYEHNFFESDETHYKEIIDLANVILKGQTITNQADLVATLLPNLKPAELNDTKLRSFLYCINYAASDIKFSEELKYMFGESYAFEAHRRSSLQFIVETIRHVNTTNDLLIDCWQPSSKVIKVDDIPDTQLVRGFKQLEGERGAKHRHWCKVFLNFHYDEDDKGGQMPQGEKTNRSD